ncbi:MAG: PorV/PorQ family protein, partial [candidate division KSB1 bacterium]|nr:PorV/PorQ family protein [candidate division KSB1 bacterium]
MKRTVLVFATAAFCVASYSAAQDISRVGTAAGQFLKLPVGARAAALGGTAVSLTDEPASLYWNPGAISTLGKKTLFVSRSNLYDNAGIYHTFLGFVLPLARSSAIGISVNYLGTDDIEITTLEAPNGMDTYYRAQDYALGLSYARYVTDRLTLGLTVKFVNEGIWREKARTAAIDLGSLLDTGVLGMRLGMSLCNFGGNLRLRGPDLRVVHDRYSTNPAERSVDAELKTLEWPLPLTFRIGTSIELIGAQGQIAVSDHNRFTLSYEMWDGMDSLMRAGFGAEYSWNSILYLRGGYYGVPLTKDEFNTYDTASYTFGGGLQYDLGWAAFRLDYALANYQILGNSHLVSFMLKL